MDTAKLVARIFCGLRAGGLLPPEPRELVEHREKMARFDAADREMDVIIAELDEADGPSERTRELEQRAFELAFTV